MFCGRQVSVDGGQNLHITLPGRRSGSRSDGMTTSVMTFPHVRRHVLLSLCCEEYSKDSFG